MPRLLVLLKFGAAAWNHWRAENPDAAIVLDGQTLDGMILTGINFSRASLRGASLHATNLMNADLREADLTGANLTEADLIGANLEGAILAGATLREADLLGANLTNAQCSAQNSSIFSRISFSNSRVFASFCSCVPVNCDGSSNGQCSRLVTPAKIGQPFDSDSLQTVIT